MCFLPWVRLSPVPNRVTFSPCWIWEGARNESGYGMVITPEGAMGAHRFALRWVWHGLDTPQWALHRCDVQPCVNPLHLYWGDQYDNGRDMRGRGSNSMRSIVPFSGKRIIKSSFAKLHKNPWKMPYPDIESGKRIIVNAGYDITTVNTVNSVNTVEVCTRQ
jgi:hypothetical protein